MNSLIKNVEQATVFNRGQASKVFKNVVETGEPVLVTQNNTALVVIISAEKYVELTGSDLTVKMPFAKSTVITPYKDGK